MGQDDSTGKWESAQVADVADIINPTRDCQSSTIASFPTGEYWNTKGGWVDGVLIICSAATDKKCFVLSEDGKIYITSMQRWKMINFCLVGFWQAPVKNPRGL